ncbi:DUF2157 domain-containing protein [Psychrobacter frigidicola]|uniref:DUF2157 domain-containing protein n=1 Tax=Psychrobacter frigidicola TaxID=45611 RepID=A0A5C7A277_9GAMM|nr:DUF2157 domain-containing protein [Psychrobacter frigidicola]TXD96782.1 DUF2157 domain-containing protein [Psychrobacter frigidicola]
MTQSRRTIENLVQQGVLPLEHADTAALELEMYPTKRTWLSFFDKAALIIGTIALVLSLVFFIAYNWLNMGKIGKFALVEGALVLTIALHVILYFRRRFQLAQQLLLLVASIITGSLLAVFGQVYQTGADTWQLFFGWALLIIPWVLIARLPALWLVWLGLVNASLILYIDVVDILFTDYIYQDILQVATLAILNLVALILWLFNIENKHNPHSSFYKTIFSKTLLSRTSLVKTTSSKTALSKSAAYQTALPTKSSLHWSTYVVGLLSTYFITYLAIITVFDEVKILPLLITLSLWASWCGFMLWRFYRRHTDLLMLTYLCGSVIAVVMVWAGKLLLDDWEAGGFLLLALLLIAMSSATVVWLRRIARFDRRGHESELLAQTRGDYE